MSLGALTVTLGLNAADFVSGMSKSEQQAKKFGQTLDRNIAAGVIKAQLALEALGAAARATAEVFQSLTVGAGQFQELADTTGASAEGIASLALAAGTAGVEVTSLGDAMNQLTKRLVGVDDESKATGAALKAIGIEVADLKKLDPVGQYEAISKALAGYADGAGKTAVAMALFGKSGAEQLKVFQDLEEQGGRQVILTAKQIAMADEYGKVQDRAKTELKLYAQAAASEAIPAISDLTKIAAELAREFLGIDKATGQLAANNGAKDFANAVADAVVFAADKVAGLSRELEGLGKFLGAFAAVSRAVLAGDLAQAKAIGAEFRSDMAELEKRITLTQRLANVRANAGLTGERLNATTDPRSLTFGKDRPVIAFGGATRPTKSTGGGAIAERTSEAERYLEALQRQLQGTQDLTEAEKVLADIQSGRLTLSGKVTQDALLGVAVQIDAAKAFEQSMKEGQAQTEEFLKEREKERKAIEDLQKADDDRLAGLLNNTGGEVFKRQQADIEFLRQAFIDGKIVAEQYGEAVAIVMGSVKDEIKDVNEFSVQAARNIQDTLGSSLELALAGKFSSIGDLWTQTIQRMIAQAAAAQLNKLLFGESYGKDGQMGGWIGAGISALGSYYGGAKAGGGPTMPNSIYRVSENRPEVYSDGSSSWLITGSQRGNVDPNPRMGGGRTINAPIYITVPGNTDRRTAGQIGAEVSRALGVASVRNN